MANKRSSPAVRWMICLALLIVPALLITLPNMTSTTRASGPAGRSQLEKTRLRLGQVSALAKESTYLGSMSPDESLYMTMSFQVQDNAGLLDTISNLYNPASPSFHQWLTPQEFGQRFGRSAAEIEQAAGWISAQGFEINQTWANNLAITFTGKVDAVERAFNVTIGQYRDERENRVFFSNDQDATLPSELRDMTVELLGLDNAYRYHTGKVKSFGTVDEQMITRKNAAAKGRWATRDAFLSNGAFYMAPADFQAAYDILPTGPQGQNQTAAIIIASDLSNGDIKKYRKLVGLPAANVQRFQVPGLTEAGFNDDPEVALDFAAISSMAPQAQIDLVLPAELSFVDVQAAENYVVNTLMPPVVNESFGACESVGFSTTEQTIFQQASTEGIAFFAAAGDDGAECTQGNSLSNIAEVGCPACYGIGVTSVGGTGANGPSNFSGIVNGSGTLIGLADEVVWNISPGISVGCSGQQLQGGSTGGGFSQTVSIPPYQFGATGFSGGVPASSGRVVPDVAMAGDPDSLDTLVVIGGKVGLFGGTSLSSPLWAGVMTLINQTKGSAQGSPNTELYRLGASQFKDGGPAVFIDITDGNNSTGVDKPCAPNGVTGQNAAVGYDAVTGWGSPDVAQILNFYGAASLPQRAAPGPPVITSLGAHLAGDVVQLSVVSNSAGENVTLAASNLLDGTGAVVAQGSPFNISTRHYVTAAYVLSISGASQFPTALSANLVITDAVGGQSGTMTASFAGADAGGPTIKGVTLAGSKMTITGSGLSGKLGLEINGTVVAAKTNSSGSSVKFKGSASTFNLQPGANRVRVALGNQPLYSNIFLLQD
jgi:subtilase family serine protease